MKRFSLHRRRIAKVYNKKEERLSLFSIGIDIFFLSSFFFIEEKISHPFIFFLLWWCIKLLPSFLFYKLKKRFGIEIQQLPQWAKRKIKEAALFLPTLTFAAYILLWMMKKEHGWLPLSFIYIGFLLFLSRIMPQILLPIFYKKKPLVGELKQKILSFFKEIGEDVENIFIVCTSKESVQMNAALAGFGKTRCILLSDTLLSLSHEEIKSIVAHEVGHKKGGHFRKIFLLQSFNATLCFYLLYLLFPLMKERLSLIFTFFLLYSLCTSPFLNFFKRRWEDEADRFSVLSTSASSFICAMIEIADRNLSPLKREGIWKHFSSHPSLIERIKKASLLKARQHQH